MDCPFIPQFCCLNFLLRSKTYLKERPFTKCKHCNSHKLEDVVRLVYTANYPAAQWFSYTVVYTSTRCLAHYVTHCLDCFVVQNIDE